MKTLSMLLVLVLACGDAVDAEEASGSWCCDDSHIELSSSAQHLSCGLTAEQAAEWTAGSCADTTLPERIPLHPGDSH